MLLQPKHIKPDEKWDTTLNRGREDWRLLKFKGFVACVPRLLKLIVWKAMKGIFNFFELPGVLEYQFRENHIAFSITCLLNCIGICNVLAVLRLWSISLKCNTIYLAVYYKWAYTERCEVGSVVYRAIKPGLYAREKTHLSGELSTQVNAK
jgi:hypothetical protein